MTVEDVNVVDAIGQDQLTGDTVLTIFDHLHWDVVDHLSRLQSKLNTYLSFIESGEILDAYPESNLTSVRIELVHQHELSVEANAFLSEAKKLFSTLGISFSWRLGVACPRN